MSLEEFNKGRSYTKYKRKVNDSNQRIKAEDINKIQSDINIQQKETNTVKDTTFEERVYTIFNNNLYTNAMFVDYFKNGQYLDINSSENIEIKYETTQLKLKQNNNNGKLLSSVIYSVHGNDVGMNDFFLIANEEIPIGANIKYYVVNNYGEKWPILPNALKLPMHLSENLKYGFRILIELSANALGESPLLNGYAILYWDEKVEEALGLTNPDLARFP